ncbi:MAG: helix-turn-helix transcriptional regulator [Burkholderiales bacterium]|nr:helix-turn-helix transcriptional regulator [Burkholderiales bacterium]
MTITNKKYSNEQMVNVRSNIFKLITNNKLSTNEVAEFLKIPYSTLRCVLYVEDYSPSYKTLNKISNSLGISVSDLLKYPDLPQYIPIIQLFEVNDFLKNIYDFRNKDKVFIESFLSNDTFAISVANKSFGIVTNNYFILKPTNTLALNTRFLIEYKQSFLFILTENAKNNQITFINMLNDKKISCDYNEIKCIAQIMAIKPQEIV